MRTAATLVFTAACAVAAVLLFQRPTVLAGHVLAAQLGEELGPRGITEVRCDDRIPIRVDGAVFQCEVADRTGARAKVRYTMDRAGKLAGEIVDEAPAPAPRRGPAPPPLTADPWGL